MKFRLVLLILVAASPLLAMADEAADADAALKTAQSDFLKKTPEEHFLYGMKYESPAWSEYALKHGLTKQRAFELAVAHSDLNKTFRQNFILASIVNGVDLNAIAAPSKQSAISILIQEDNRKALERALEYNRVDPNLIVNGRSLIQITAGNCWETATGLLLQQGADVFKVGQFNRRDALTTAAVAVSRTNPGRKQKRCERTHLLVTVAAGRPTLDRIIAKNIETNGKITDSERKTAAYFISEMSRHLAQELEKERKKESQRGE